jgi:hypothetical protein
MNSSALSRRLLVTFTALVAAAAGIAAAPPETTPDGLALVKDAPADLVYRRPGVSFAGYKQILLVEPTIAFRKHWQTNVQMQDPRHPVSSEDMAKMIAQGKKMLLEAFAEELTKAGYTLANGVGPDALALKPAILDLDVYVPDPNNLLMGMASKTYTDGAGEATLLLELYDSETGQLLARAFDQKGGSGDNYTWRIPRNQATNVSAARNALADWAAMFVRGLERAKTAKAQ